MLAKELTLAYFELPDQQAFSIDRVINKCGRSGDVSSAINLCQGGYVVAGFYLFVSISGKITQNVVNGLYKNLLEMSITDKEQMNPFWFVTACKEMS